MRLIDPIELKETIAISSMIGDRRTLEQMIDDTPTIDPEPHWIPCSERLPEESGRYLISAFDGAVGRTTIAPYQPRCKAWTMTGRMAYWKVIAWMPLPTPYTESEEEDVDVKS